MVTPTPKQCGAQYSPVQPDVIDESSFNDFNIFLYELACWLQRRQELMKCNTDCIGGWVVHRSTSTSLSLVSRQSAFLGIKLQLHCWSPGPVSHWVSLEKEELTLQLNISLITNHYEWIWCFHCSVPAVFYWLLIVADWLAGWEIWDYNVGSTRHQISPAVKPAVGSFRSQNHRACEWANDSPSDSRAQSTGFTAVSFLSKIACRHARPDRLNVSLAI